MNSRPRRTIAVALSSMLVVAALAWGTAVVHADPAAWSASDSPVGLTGAEATPRWEVSVAIDPTNPDRMLASAVDNDRPPGPPTGWRNWFGLSINASSDGGRTWADHGNALLVGNDGQALPCNGAVGVDPSVTFDVNGVAYLSHLSYGLDPTEDCPDWTLAVQTSTDGGATWNAPVVVDHADPDGDCPPDRDNLVADPARGIVYLAWSRLCSVTQNVISSSRDGGRTWSEAVLVSESQSEEGYAPSPGVASDGTVYVGYYRAAPFNGCPYVIGTTVGNLASAEAVVAVSHDQGATWSRAVVGPMCDNEYQVPEQPFWGGADFSWPSLAVDGETGMVGIAWSNRDRPFSAVHVSVSRDGGQTWGEQVALPHAGRSGFMPELAAAGGMLRLTYVAMNSSGMYDAIYRESADGVTWSDPFTLNTAPSCNCWGGVNGPGIGYSKIGDYIGIDARAGRVVAAWPDNRDPTEMQNIFARAASY